VAAIVHFQQQRIGGVEQFDFDMARAGVLEHLGQGFMQNAQQIQILQRDLIHVFQMPHAPAHMEFMCLEPTPHAMT
jgi:hypothetical protein